MKFPFQSKSTSTQLADASAAPHSTAAQLPLDRAAIGAISLLSLVLGGVLVAGARQPKLAPSGLLFSWSNQTISADEPAFFLEFDEPMAWDSVAQNLEIEPPLAGQASWAGRRFAYTLTDLPEYGQQYQLKLSQAQTQPLSPRQASQTLPDFTAEFQVRDRAFAYIGVKDEEQGRLILFNLTTGKRIPLTPPDLVVTNFQPSADGRAIVFLAFATNAPDGINQQQLYRVTTGHKVDHQEPEAPGSLELILDADRYENRQFALSPAADTLIVERVNRQNPDDRGLRLVSAGGNTHSLGHYSDNFSLSPDGDVFAVSQPTGVTLVPLTAKADPQISFPNYEALLTFSRQDQRRKIMVRDNGDLTRSLMLITPEGQEREVLRTGGFISRCEFEPRQEKFLYCIQAEAIDAAQTQIQPFLTLVNLATGNVIPLIALTDDRDVRMDVSPDGRTLLFDQVTADVETPVRPNALPQGSLWLVKLPDFTQRQRTHALESPDNVAVGLDPQWLP